MRFPRALLPFIALTTASLALPSMPAYASEFVAKEGKAIYSSDGKKLGSIYKVAPDGAARVFLDNRLFTVPADSITEADGKIVTNLTKRDIITLRR